VHDEWCKELKEHPKSINKKALVDDYIKYFVNKDDISKSLIKGITTNPSLVYRGFLKSNIFGDIHQKAKEDLFSKDPYELTWSLYKLTLTETAEHLMPLWTATSGKFGWVCAQVTPDSVFNKELMIKQGIELAELSPNIMAKIPGSSQGYEAIEELTALGISTNNTLSYTLPQFLACAESIEKGLKRAKEKNVCLKRWRAVVTDMIGRFGDQQALLDEASGKGITLTTEDIRWAELAILKKTYKILKQKNTPLKILLASLRIEADKGMCWHLQKTAGADLVYTLPPSFIQTLVHHEDKLAKPAACAIEEEPPHNVLQKLSSLEYFAKAYAADGLDNNEFNNHPALLYSVKELANIYGEFLSFSKNLLNN
jgi:transaldolase